jgi:hypothetical protein
VHYVCKRRTETQKASLHLAESAGAESNKIEWKGGGGRGVAVKVEREKHTYKG